MKKIILANIAAAALLGFSSNASALGQYCWDVTDAATLAPITTLQMQASPQGANIYAFSGLDKVVTWTVHGTGVATPFGITIGLESIQGSLNSYTLNGDLNAASLSGNVNMSKGGIDTNVTMTNVPCVAPLTVKTKKTR